MPQCSRTNLENKATNGCFLGGEFVYTIRYEVKAVHREERTGQLQALRYIWTISITVTRTNKLVGTNLQIVFYENLTVTFSDHPTIPLCICLWNIEVFSSIPLGHDLWTQGNKYSYQPLSSTWKSLDLFTQIKRTVCLEISTPIRIPVICFV
jgi:hypothetical protein